MLRAVLRTLMAIAVLFLPVAVHAGCSAPTTYTPTIDTNHGGTTITFGGQTNCVNNLGMTSVQLEVDIYSKTFYGWSTYPMATLFHQASSPNIYLSGPVRCVNGTSQYWVKSTVNWSDSSGSYTNTSQNFGNFPCPTP